MYKEILRNIEGIDSYPLVSLIVFIVFFVSLLIWVMTMKKSVVAEMSQLPLDSDKSDNVFAEYNGGDIKNDK